MASPAAGISLTDCRRPNKVHRYVPPTQETVALDPTPDYMNLLGMVFSMCGLMLKMKWAAWAAVYCAFISFANSRSSEDTKQMTEEREGPVVEGRRRRLRSQKPIEIVDGEAPAEPRKRRPKKKENTSTNIEALEALTASLEKDNDGSVDRNLFDPADSPKGKGPSERRRRSKARQPPEDVEEGEVEGGVTNPTYEDDATVDTPTKKKVRKRRGERTRKAKTDENAAEDVETARTEEPEEEATPAAAVAEPEAEPQPAADNTFDPRTIAESGRVLSVFVHRTDRLKTDLNINHPLVRVHVVDMETGAYLEKQTADRPVTSLYEPVDKVDYLLPVLSQPCNFVAQGSSLPVWEERLVFNENFAYVAENERALILFEILDFVRAQTASQNYSSTQSESGWYRIAWAFLRPVGSNGVSNVGTKVRLQLYEPINSKMQAPSEKTPYCMEWWKMGIARRVAYPSTIYVTIEDLNLGPQERLEPGLRSLLPLQKEQGHESFEALKDHAGGVVDDEDTTRLKMPTDWDRLPGQLCRIPNRLAKTLPVGTQGCSSLKFSCDGRYLLVATIDREDCPLLLFDYPDGNERLRLRGHLRLVYDLCWSTDNKRVLSASADGTARVWSTSTGTEEKCLGHPSFVYAAQFHPKLADRLAVTGGFDSVIRVWGLDAGRSDLLQEISEHRSHINGLQFLGDGKLLYSADAVGVLHVWNVFITEQVGPRPFVRDWTLYKSIKDPELRGVPISCVTRHPSDKRMLVHTQDNSLRMLDLRGHLVMQRYLGALNYRERLRSVVSPCGTFVVSGSEDEAVYVWNSETGDQVACYRTLRLGAAVCAVDFHPKDNACAFGAVSPSSGVLLYRHDSELARSDGIDLLFQQSGSPRPGSPEMRGDRLLALDTGRSTAGVAEQESRLATLRGERQATDADRFRRAIQTLRSVTTTSLPGQTELNNTAPVQGTTGGTTWNTNWDTSTMGATNMSLGDSARQHAGQRAYMQEGGGGWRPQWSSIGRKGTRDTQMRPPQLSLTRNAISGASFTVHKTKDSVAVEDLLTVVAMYDYQAHRSDELSFSRGALIKVLFEDSANWWMGELANGSQGYFPSNYVTGDPSKEKPREKVPETMTREAEEEAAVPEELPESTETTPKREKKTRTRPPSGARSRRRKGADAPPPEEGAQELTETEPVRGKERRRRTRFRGDDAEDAAGGVMESTA